MDIFDLNINLKNLRRDIETTRARIIIHEKKSEQFRALRRETSKSFGARSHEVHAVDVKIRLNNERRLMVIRRFDKKYVNKIMSKLYN